MNEQNAQSFATAVPSHSPMPNWVPGPPPTPPRHSRLKVALVVIAVVTVLAIVSTVSTILIANHRAAVAAQQRAHKVAVAKAKAEAQAEQRAEAQERQQTYNACIDQVGDLETALTDLNSRLDAGMTQADYGDAVGDASVAYGHIDIDVLSAGSSDCVTAAASLETALNAYITANTKWNDCITDFSCDANSDALEQSLQKQWTKASASLDDARRTLDQLNPDASGSGTSS